MEEQQKRNTPLSRCVGCGHWIFDRVELKVFPDLRWHAECLKCVECQRNLAESNSCFIKDGKMLCRKDYHRLFSCRCAGCLTCISSNDYVMRAGHHIFHVSCFRCDHCHRILRPKDEIMLQDGFPVCISHRQDACPAGQMNQLTYLEKCTDGGKASRSERGSRMRTVLSEAQLHVLRSCYDSNPRPDALLKEQLVELTGLSSRVIRVWFQNKRCKDKKRNMLQTPMEHGTTEQAKPPDEVMFTTIPETLDMPVKTLDLLNIQRCWKHLSAHSFHPNVLFTETPGQQPENTHLHTLVNTHGAVGSPSHGTRGAVSGSMPRSTTLQS